jgi:hypothetical protein
MLSKLTFVKEVTVVETITETKTIYQPVPVIIVKDSDCVVDNSVTDKSLDNSGYLIYQDNNIKVTYVGQEEKVYGPVLYFKIQNLSSETLNVLCTDVYIDGQLVFISGLTCENLLPNTEVVEEFVLTPKDGKQLTDIDYVSFIIKLVKSKSYLDLYESNRITINP